METKTQAKAAKARFLVPVACVLAAGLVLAVGDQDTHKFIFVDNTTQDQSMSNPTAPHIEPVPCNNDSQGVEAKCSTRTSWATVTTDSQLTCSSIDTRINFRDKTDHDNTWDVDWACADGKPDGAVDVKQEVTLEGELSLCRTTNTITASSTCNWIFDTD